MLGGNFVRAIPDRDQMEPAWRRMRLTVNVATKLNRSHLVHGEISFVLPVLGRIERDVQASGEQSTSMEDSTACVHGSRGVRAPASKTSDQRGQASRRDRQILARSQPPRALGRLGAMTTAESALRSGRPIQTSSTTTIGGCGSLVVFIEIACP